MREETDAGSCVWEYWPGTGVELAGLEDGLVAIYEPGEHSRRIGAQQSVFTVRDLPEDTQEFVPMNHDPAVVSRMRQLRVPAASRSVLRSQLDKLGYNPARLFPDLDGVAKSLV